MSVSNTDHTATQPTESREDEARRLLQQAREEHDRKQLELRQQAMQDGYLSKLKKWEEYDKRTQELTQKVAQELKEMTGAGMYAYESGASTRVAAFKIFMLMAQEFYERDLWRRIGHIDKAKLMLIPIAVNLKSLASDKLKEQFPFLDNEPSIGLELGHDDDTVAFNITSSKLGKEAFDMDEEFSSVMQEYYKASFADFLEEKHPNEYTVDADGKISAVTDPNAAAGAPDADIPWTDLATEFQIYLQDNKKLKINHTVELAQPSPSPAA